MKYLISVIFLCILLQIQQNAYPINLELDLDEFVMEKKSIADNYSQQAKYLNLAGYFAGILALVMTALQGVKREKIVKGITIGLGIIVAGLTQANELFDADPGSLKNAAREINYEVEIFETTFDGLDLSDADISAKYRSSKVILIKKINLITSKVSEQKMRDVEDISSNLDGGSYLKNTFLATGLLANNTPENSDTQSGTEKTMLSEQKFAAYVDPEKRYYYLEGEKYGLGRRARVSMLDSHNSLFITGFGQAGSLREAEMNAEISAHTNYDLLVNYLLYPEMSNSGSNENHSGETHSTPVSDVVFSTSDVITEKFFKKDGKYHYFIIKRIGRESMMEYYSLLFREDDNEERIMGVRRLKEYLENEQGVIPTKNPVSGE